MHTKKKYIWMIGISILLITFFHYYTTSSVWGFHDFYRRLYYIPIILGAFKFGLRGALFSSLAVTLLYAPHLFLYFGKINIEVINQLLEIIMFIIIGAITGILIESETRAKRLLEIQIMKLTDLENYTKNILESILNGVIAIDKNMKITSINKEGKNILNIFGEEKGNHIYAYFENSKEIQKIISQAMSRDEKIQGYETYLLTKENDKLIVKIYGYPLKNILEKTVGMVMIVEDISEIKKLENHVRRVDKLSAIGELASGIAHEIRNPLGIIKTVSQTINKEVEDLEIKEGLEIIESEIDRANNVISELLDFAKPSVFNRQYQSIHQVIQNVLVIIKKYAEQNKVQIQCESQEDYFVYIDQGKLKQAFINILLNSIQAMPKGGNLFIQVINEKQWLKISFKDEGSGIEKEKLEKVFEPFYTTKEKGIGLGLPITYRIIEEHGGYLEVESELGLGTSVNIFLPMKEDGGMLNG